MHTRSAAGDACVRDASRAAKELNLRRQGIWGLAIMGGCLTEPRTTMTTTIRYADLVESVAAALQYISTPHVVA